MPKSRKLSRRRRKQRRVRKTIRHHRIRGGNLFDDNSARKVHIMKYDNTLKFDNNSPMCPITQYDFINGEYVALTDCRHMFNPKALHDYLKTLQNSHKDLLCPLCSKKLQMFDLPFYIQNNTNTAS